VLSTLVTGYFQSTFNLEIKNGKIMFRPEQFTIAGPDEFPVQGIIRKIMYMGSGYLLSVQLLDQEILVHTLHSNFSIHDKIGLLPDTAGACYMNNN
jgi:ABC-type Fe3+/spermidine/putrescine transport system ATPase subunit